MTAEQAKTVRFEQAMEQIKASGGVNKQQPEFVTLELATDETLEETRLAQLIQCIRETSFKGALNYEGISLDEKYPYSSVTKLYLDTQIAIRDNNIRYLESQEPLTRDNCEKLVVYKMEMLMLKKNVHEDKDHPEMIRLLDDFADELQNFDGEESITFAIESRRKAHEMRKRMSSEPDSEELAKSLMSLGSTYINARFYKPALAEFEACLAMIKRMHKDGQTADSGQTAKCLYSIGFCQHHCKDDVAALDNKNQSLEMYQRLHGKSDHVEIARVLASLGTTYDSLGNGEKAMECTVRGLEMRERLCGEEEHKSDKLIQLDLVRSYNFLANLYFSTLKDTKKSFQFNERALELCKMINNARSQMVQAETLMTMARKCGIENQYSKCIEYCLESLKIRNALESGVPTKKAEETLYMTAMAYSSAKEHKTALSYLTKAYETYKALASVAVPSAELLTYYKQLGHVHFTLREIELARDYFLKALDTNDKLHGGETVQEETLTFLLTRLGECYCMLGNFHKALVYQLRLIEVRKKLDQVKDSAGMAHLLSDTGICYQNVGQASESLKFKTEAYEMIKRVTKNEDSGDAVIILLSLATTYHVLNDLENMEKYGNMALDMSRRVHCNADNLQTAEALTYLGISANTRNNVPEALRLHSEALEMRKRLCTDKGNEDIVNSYSNMGLVYDRQGEHEKALTMHEQALAMSRKIARRVDHILVAACLEFYGDSCMQAKAHESALKHYLEALDIKRKLFADMEASADIEKLLQKVYMNYGSMNDYENGLKYYSEAYELAKKLYKPVSEPMVEYLNNMGVIHTGLQQPDKALDFYKTALDMCKKLYNDDEPIIGLLLTNIGAIYTHRGDHSAALQYQLEALSIDSKSTVSDVYQTKRDSTLLMDIALSYEMGFDYNTSLQYKQNYLELLTKDKDGEDYANVAHVLDSISETHRLLQKKEPLIEYKLKALEMFKRLNEKDPSKELHNPELVDLYKSLAEIYMYDGEYAKALEYYVVVPDMTRKLLDDTPEVYPKIKEGLKGSLLNIIECYGRLNDKANVEKYQEELEKLKNKTYSKACVIS